MSPTLYRWLADGVVAVHAAFVFFVLIGLVMIIVGGVLHWAWVRNVYFRIAHLAAIGIVVVQSWMGQTCPLTLLEEWLRNQAGESRYGGDVPGFIGYWAHRLIFFSAPPWVFTVCYTLFALLVVLTLVFIPPRRQRAISHVPITAAPQP
jgi:hypothetical protein